MWHVYYDVVVTVENGSPLPVVWHVHYVDCLRCSRHGNWLSSTCCVTRTLSGRKLNLTHSIPTRRITYSMQHLSGTFTRSLPWFLPVSNITSHYSARQQTSPRASDVTANLPQKFCIRNPTAFPYCCHGNNITATEKRCIKYWWSISETRIVRIQLFSSSTLSSMLSSTEVRLWSVAVSATLCVHPCLLTYLPEVTTEGGIEMRLLLLLLL